jgi:hypothetical protein
MRLSERSGALTVRDGQGPRATPYGIVPKRDPNGDRNRDSNGDSNGDWHPKLALLEPAQLEQALSPHLQGTGIASPRTDNL